MLSPAQTLLHHLRRLTCPATGDALLLSRWINGRDEDAFAALIARHGPMVFGVCRRVLGDGPDAEDAFQASCLILARKAASLRRPEALAGWLHGVAARLAWKARAARRRDVPSRTLALEPADSRPDPLELVTVRELLALLDREIGELPEVYRLPVVLCDLEGRTQEEAAEMLGWTLGSLRGRHLRGRTRLKTRLARRGLALPAGVVLPLIPAALAGSSEAAAPVLAPQTIAEVSRCAVLFSTHPATEQVPARAAELARDGLRVLMLSKLKIAAVVVMGVCLAGAGLMASRMREAKPVEERREDKAPPSANATPKPAAERPPVRLDRFGDPLPERAVARMGTVRFRHGEGIAGIALSPDDKTIASASLDGTVRLWDSASGKEQHRFRIHQAPALAVIFSADGKQLAAMGGDGRVYLWALPGGEQIHVFGRQNEILTCFALAPDGKTLATGHRDFNRRNNLVRIWDAIGGKELRHIKGHEKQIKSLAFSPDGKRLASTSADSSLRLWNPSTGQETRRIDLPTAAEERHPLPVAFSPRGETIAAGCADKIIRFWDIASAKELRQLRGHEADVTCLAFTADGKTLFSGGRDRAVWRWNVSDGKGGRRLFAQSGRVETFALSRDCKRLAAANGGVIRLLNALDGEELRPAPGHRGWIWCIALSRDGRRLASTGEDGTIHTWDAATGAETGQLCDSKERVYILAWSPDGRTLASVGHDRTIRLWERDSEKEPGQIRGHRSAVLSVAWSADGKRLLSGGADGTVLVWKDGAEERLRLPEQTGALRQLAISPHGDRAAWTVGEDASIYLGDITKGRKPRRLEGPKNMVRCLAFSPDSQMLASSGVAQPISLWDAHTGQPIRQLARQTSNGRTRDVFHLVFSPDGKTLMSAEEDGRTILWEVRTGKPRAELTGHQGSVLSLSLSADGKRLASAGTDTTALVWDLTGRSERVQTPRLENLWDDLGGADAAKAYRAICRMATYPERIESFLAKHLLPVPQPDAARLTRLLADLESADFAEREKAMRQLEAMGEAIEGACRETLKSRPGLELRRRIELVLDKIDPEKSTEGMRRLRALEALERREDPEARRILQRLADGAADARLTREAKAAFLRIQARQQHR